MEALHININKQLLSVTYKFYTEITVTTDMQHLQGITHKHTGNYNHIYYKQQHRNVNNKQNIIFITQLVLICEILSPTTCILSTNLPAIDYTVHHSQQ